MKYTNMFPDLEVESIGLIFISWFHLGRLQIPMNRKKFIANYLLASRIYLTEDILR